MIDALVALTSLLHLPTSVLARLSAAQLAAAENAYQAARGPWDTGMRLETSAWGWTRKHVFTGADLAAYVDACLEYEKEQRKAWYDLPSPLQPVAPTDWLATLPAPLPYEEWSVVEHRYRR